MKNQNNFKYAVYALAFIVFMSNIAIVLANDDENKNGAIVELISIIFEIFIGFCVGICTENPSCNYFLTWFVFMFIFITIISMIFCGYRPRFKRRDVQSCVNVYVGMRLARK